MCLGFHSEKWTYKFENESTQKKRELSIIAEIQPYCLTNLGAYNSEC